MRRDGKMSQSELRHHKKFIRECQEDAKNERYQLVMTSGEVLDFVTGAEVDEYVKSIDYNYSLITTVRIIHAIKGSHDWPIDRYKNFFELSRLIKK